MRSTESSLRERLHRRVPVVPSGAPPTEPSARPGPNLLLALGATSLAVVTVAIALWGVWAWLVALGLAGAIAALSREQLALGLSAAARDRSHDPLTGMLDLRGFEQSLELELERARRTHGTLSVIVGEIDRGEPPGERAGRIAGDGALRDVAPILTQGKRSWDSVAWVGGDEFALLAPATDDHGAYSLAERLRTSIERAFLAHERGPMTASFGIVSYPVHGQSREALLHAAHEALLAARHLGSNRCVISSAEVPEIIARGSARHEDPGVELATLLSLAEALDLRESGNRTHCQRVGRYAELIARELGLPPDSVERLRIAGILHDVGRLAVPDELLARSGPLTDEDWQWIRSHPEVGARLLETTRFTDIGEWILAHHERPDGTGYPAGRGQGEVPIEAAVLGVADAYEAMTSRRPYRAALGPGEAAEELRRGAGRQFDEQVVDALLRVI